MKLFKTFLAGMAFPAIFLPFVYTYFFLQGNPVTTQAPMALAAHFAPLFMGLWNIIAISLRPYIHIKNTLASCTASGIVLGIITGTLGAFVYPVFGVLFGFEGILLYSPLIFYPVFFALIFRYIVHPLNEDFGVY